MRTYDSRGCGRGHAGRRGGVRCGPFRGQQGPRARGPREGDLQGAGSRGIAVRSPGRPDQRSAQRVHEVRAQFRGEASYAHERPPDRRRQGRLRLQAREGRCDSGDPRPVPADSGRRPAFSPALRRTEQEFETMRFDMQEERVRLLFTQRKARKDLSLEEARRILWMYTSREIYRMLVQESGWTPDQYQAWLSKTSVATLVEPA